MNIKKTKTDNIIEYFLIKKNKTIGVASIEISNMKDFISELESIKKWNINDDSDKRKIEEKIKYYQKKKNKNIYIHSIEIEKNIEIKDMENI